MSKTASATAPNTKTAASQAGSPADLKLWSDFLGRSESMNKHTRTTSSTSEAVARRSSEIDDEATVDSILADYRSREAQRRRSNASEADTANVPAAGFKTAYGEPPEAILNRIRGFLGNIVDGKGWRRT